jgi:hypothetical protein
MAEGVIAKGELGWGKWGEDNRLSGFTPCNSSVLSCHV